MRSSPAGTTTGQLAADCRPTAASPDPDTSLPVEADQDSFVEAVEAVGDRVHVVGDPHEAGGGAEAVPGLGRALAAAGGDLTAGLWWALVERAVTALGDRKAGTGRGFQGGAGGGGEALHQRPPGQ